MAAIDHSALFPRQSARRGETAGRRWRAAQAALLRATDALLDWQDRARQRRQLLSLGDRALMDLGRSRAEAEAEAGKPFWRG
jgi:uncharacterized protein YjiS (DUF1127 family)